MNLQLVHNHFRCCHCGVDSFVQVQCSVAVCCRHYSLQVLYLSVAALLVAIQYILNSQDCRQVSTLPQTRYMHSSE